MGHEDATYSTLMHTPQTYTTDVYPNVSSSNQTDYKNPRHSLWTFNISTACPFSAPKVLLSFCDHYVITLVRQPGGLQHLPQVPYRLITNCSCPSLQCDYYNINHGRSNDKSIPTTNRIPHRKKTQASSQPNDATTLPETNVDSSDPKSNATQRLRIFYGWHSENQSSPPPKSHNRLQHMQTPTPQMRRNTTGVSPLSQIRLPSWR